MLGPLSQDSINRSIIMHAYADAGLLARGLTARHPNYTSLAAGVAVIYIQCCGQVVAYNYYRQQVALLLCDDSFGLFIVLRTVRYCW